MITFKKVGRRDYMGFAWYAAYCNGKPVMVRGTHLMYHAQDENHAELIHKSL